MASSNFALNTAERQNHRQHKVPEVLAHESSPVPPRRKQKVLLLVVAIILLMLILNIIGDYRENQIQDQTPPATTPVASAPTAISDKSYMVPSMFTPPPSVESWTEYKSDEFRFSMWYPPNLSVQATSPSYKATFCQRDDCIFQPSMLSLDWTRSDSMLPTPRGGGSWVLSLDIMKKTPDQSLEEVAQQVSAECSFLLEPPHPIVINTFVSGIAYTCSGQDVLQEVMLPLKRHPDEYIVLTWSSSYNEIIQQVIATITIED